MFSRLYGGLLRHLALQARGFGKGSQSFALFVFTWNDIVSSSVAALMPNDNT
jgi:hypothetical protein